MIPLTIRALDSSNDDPYVVRLKSNKSQIENEADFWIRKMPTVGAVATSATKTIYFPNNTSSELDGDVLLVTPTKGLANRLIRAASSHNTFLVTEQCDQLCVMCSQPPKKHHHDLFSELTTAALLAPKGAVIGISGGEPTLHKADLFNLLTDVLSKRPDLQFHVLTNAQHFSENDLHFLKDKINRNIVWGIPIYSDVPDVHDQIVSKKDAFENLLQNLTLFIRAGARLEIRTVIMQQNARTLPNLARFLSKQLGNAETWAVMQLENIGYARKNWVDIFYDHSVDFTPISEGLRAAILNELPTKLYNFPLCTIPSEFREFAVPSISDWKKKNIDICKNCNALNSCSGFFEWYDHTNGFRQVGAL